jgi:alkanesulfonate monooxygenase
VELRVFVEPQLGASYGDQLAVARVAEDCGYGAFFRSDHYLVMGDGDPRPGPTDSWVTLGALARETSTIRLGTMVTSATFRHPGPLAISVAQVDAMSGGRVEFGIGAGWFEAEHRAYGIPFPPVGERFDRLEEQLEILIGLWATPAGDTFSFAGVHYELSDSPALPKPVQQPVPVIIGGGGPRRTPALAARFATEFNMPFASVDRTREQFDRVRAACEAAGRDPGSMILSAAIEVCVGSDETEVERRASTIGRTAAQMREAGAAGTPDEAVATLRAFAEAGASRAYVQFLDMRDLDHIRLVAEEVMPHLP